MRHRLYGLIHSSSAGTHYLMTMVKPSDDRYLYITHQTGRLFSLGHWSHAIFGVWHRYIDCIVQRVRCEVNIGPAVPRQRPAPASKVPKGI